MARFRPGGAAREGRLPGLSRVHIDAGGAVELVARGLALANWHPPLGARQGD